MAELLKKITLDGTELEICDDTTRSASTTNAANIAIIADTVDGIVKKKGVNITYDNSTSTLVITHN